MEQGGRGLSVRGVFVETKGNGNTDTHGECPRRGSQANVTGHLHSEYRGPGPGEADPAGTWTSSLRSLELEGQLKKPPPPGRGSLQPRCEARHVEVQLLPRGGWCGPGDMWGWAGRGLGLAGRT